MRTLRCAFYAARLSPRYLQTIHPQALALPNVFGKIRSWRGRAQKMQKCDSGPGGRRFKSSRPDFWIQTDTARFGMPPKRAVAVFVDVKTPVIVRFSQIGEDYR